MAIRTLSTKRVKKPNEPPPTIHVKFNDPKIKINKSIRLRRNPY